MQSAKSATADELVNGIFDSTILHLTNELERDNIKKNVCAGIEKAIDVFTQIENPLEERDWANTKYPGFSKAYALSVFWRSISESIGYGIEPSQVETISSNLSFPQKYLTMLNLELYGHKNTYAVVIRKKVTRTLLDMKVMNDRTPC